MSNLQDGKISLFQSLFGRIGVSSTEVKRCTWLSVLITIGITTLGGVVEFTTNSVNFIEASLATIEHFANALPFSILLCIIGLVIVHFFRGVKMLYSKKVREELITEGREQGREEAKVWYEAKENNPDYNEPPPWEKNTMTTRDGETSDNDK